MGGAGEGSVRILITGAKGMLGTDLRGFLAEQHTVIGLDMDGLDITDLEQSIAAVREYTPDVVINCAAYTNVDGCENEIDLAYRVNAIGPRNLAVACERIGAALVHISTDYVFPGDSSYPYREDDLTGPKSIYGKSKLAGENYIRSLSYRYFIIRTSWLYGKNGHNFVKTILRAAQEGNPLSVVNDQTGSPTYTRDLVKAISSLIASPAYGTYHLTNSGACTWFDFTKDILDLAGIQNEVRPTTTKELNRPAPRPAYSVMDNFNWRLLGYESLRHYKEALKEYLAEEGVVK